MDLCHINLSKELRGGEVQMLALIDCLADRYEQSVIVRRDSPLHRHLADRARSALDIIPVPSSVPAAVRAARKFDLLHVHEGRSVQVGAWASLFGTRFVVTRRVPSLPKHDLFTRWFYSRASATIGVSETVSAIMRGYLGDSAVQTILDYVPTIPVDADRVAALRREHAGRVVVGHVGELHDAHKGQMVILQAAREALKHHPDLLFVLVGGGCDADALHRQGRDLPNVEFVGWVDNVGDYYSVMDVFVFPSRTEALGSAMLEAMSFGLPVIAAAVGGIPEIVKPGINGALFAAGDAAGLLRHVVDIMTDATLRQALGSGARATAAAHSVEAGAAQYADVYERVAGRRVAADSAVRVGAAMSGRRHGAD
ncbi:MAG TPA: glycosyltransferase [Gammaproteobacteria bacterium]|nr:glycosyltransferase [Gammaproteobacteria bacterium]